MSTLSLPFGTPLFAASIVAMMPYSWCHHEPHQPPHVPCGGGGMGEGGEAKGGTNEGGAAGQGGQAEGGTGGEGGGGGQVPTVRPALAVIVDYADAAFEEWNGLGMNDAEDLAIQLEQMSEHWMFLSHGLEDMQWQIIRVTLSQPMSDSAYPDFAAFRDEVALLIRAQVDEADYDFDGDGVIDTAWAVVTTLGQTPPYLLGGTSQHQGVNMFVDGQDSGSIIAGATGNFNHEVGHTRGLPDMYGDYGNLSDLTLMAGSWPLPPNDFAAFERVKLGWMTPISVDETTIGVELFDANLHFKAIRVPTVRPEEYFLVEYRNRPETGFGSAMAFDANGLAVYHILETSNQGNDPPLAKLEPADGTTQPNLVPEADDFAFPGNPAMTSPFIMRTYFGGDPVFRIENLQWTAGGIRFDVVVLSAGEGSAVPVPIANATFETGTTDWSINAYLPGNASFDWASIGANGSDHSASITADVSNDAEWFTSVNGLTAGASYQLCGFVRGQNVAEGAGATMSITQSFTQSAGLHGTFDFTRACVVATASATTMNISCRLGGFAATSVGQMWCDDVSLTPLESVFSAPSAQGTIDQEGVEDMVIP
ncbi:MAG: hypothetical protein HOW73_28495 [Polyangiaceae bacterium]|nr:hypothetical protein [Polyangiaceae bacterium]